MDNWKKGGFSGVATGAKKWFIDNEDNFGIVCCYMNLPPGWSYPKHFHKERSETIVVLEGNITVITEEEQIFLTSGEFFSIKKNTSFELLTPSKPSGAKVIFIHPAGENDTILSGKCL